MNDLQRCRYAVRDRTGWLTLDRPQALNGVDEALLGDLGSVIAAVRDDPDVRALVITGAGEAFCVGLDLGLLEKAFADLDYFGDVLERFNGVLHDLEDLDLPVIAAVNGLTRAGGFELMLACDLFVAADEARIADHHASFGMMPGGGATQRLPRKIGDQRARALIMTARWLTGAQAVDWGLALDSVPRAALEDRADALAAELVDKPRACLGAIKAAMAGGADLPIRAAVQIEIDTFRRYMAEHDAGHEGFTAYREGRDPSWR
jgi:enoyl-CoA hydratase/carnithine racemase